MANDDRMMGSPIKSVLHTYELLEYVLCNLPTEQLAQAQRVCHAWRDLIVRSSALQMKLIIQAIQAGSASECESTLTSDPDLTPQLVDWEPDLADIGFCEVYPLIKTDIRAIDYVAEGRLPTVFAEPCIERMFSWRPGGWQAMYLTQPPCRAVELDLSNRYETIVITESGGVRLGQVVEKLREHFPSGVIVDDRSEGEPNKVSLSVRIEGLFPESVELGICKRVGNRTAGSNSNEERNSWRVVQGVLQSERLP